MYIKYMPNINIILDDYTDVNNIMNVLQGVRGKWNTDVNNIMHVLIRYTEFKINSN